LRLGGVASALYTFVMRLTYLCWCLAAQLLSAFGHKLRGVDDGPPPVDLVKHNLQIGTAAAKISALKVKSVYAANSAQAAAAKAATAKLHVEELYVKTMNVMPELNAVKKLAKSQAAKANAASKETIGFRKGIEKKVSEIMTDSKLLAVQAVKGLLKEKYKELSEWRHKVLANPWEKGQVAAAKAASPYFKTMGTFAAHMAAYGLEASTMKGQAAADLANAKSLAGGVEAKREAGDPIGAEQDAELAKALETQSAQLAGRAKTLEGQVASMQNVVPQYSGAAHMAAWNAEFNANPDSVPPPPVDPNFAFTPAPPKLP